MELICSIEYFEMLIDLVFINFYYKVVEFGVFDFGFSDYLFVYCVFKFGCFWVVLKIIEYCLYKNYNKDFFIEDFENIFWYVVFNNIDNVDDCVNIWNKLFLDVVEVYVLIKI